MFRIIQKSLRRRGVQFAKCPAPFFESPPIFDWLLNQSWILEKGERFKFVQVGANDGISGGDPLRKYILQRNWTGILIEPQPDVFHRLKENYSNASNLIFENIGISKSESSYTLYRNPNELTTAALNKRVVEKQNKGLKIESIEVECFSLKQIIKKHSFYDLDLLQIDTEGHELEVLSSLDFIKTKPRIIQFEHGHLSRSRLSRIVEKLVEGGYEIHYGGMNYRDSLATLPGN